MISLVAGLLLVVISLQIRIIKKMASFSEVNTALATLSTDVDAKFADISTKVSAIENGAVVGATPEQLDTVLATVSTLNSKVNAFTLSVPTPAS